MNNFDFSALKINNGQYGKMQKNSIIFSTVCTSQNDLFTNRKTDPSRCMGVMFCLRYPCVTFDLLKSLSLVNSSSSRSQTQWLHSNGGGHKNNFSIMDLKEKKLFLFLTSKNKLFLWKNQKQINDSMK